MSVASLAQGQSIESKKCRSCGKLLKECPYKGKHPQQQQTTQAPAPKPKEGSVYVTSTPSGAVVKLDGTYKGETPLTIEELSVGNHTVTFNKEGFESATRTVSVTAGKKAECSATLKKKSTSSGVRMDGDDLVFTCEGTEYHYKMVYVSGGTYTMGCTSEQGDNCRDNERPAHRVTVSGFYMGQTEVTQALWMAVMGSEPYVYYGHAWNEADGRGPNYPAYSVTYDDIKKFISKLNSQTGKNFRLPTEAEWEFSARGGNNSKGYKYSGSNNIDDVAWYGENSGSKLHPVALKQSNELGLYDMSGNLDEFCNDWSAERYSGDEQNNPQGPTSGSYVVTRGGNYYKSDPKYSIYPDDLGCRVTFRGSFPPDMDATFIGFRLAL